MTDFKTFDRLAPAVRRALTETAFDMDVRIFARLPEQQALEVINEIDRDVRAAALSDLPPPRQRKY